MFFCQFTSVTKKLLKSVSPVGCIWKMLWYKQDPPSTAVATILNQDEIEVEREMREAAFSIETAAKGHEKRQRMET